MLLCTRASTQVLEGYIFISGLNLDFHGVSCWNHHRPPSSKLAAQCPSHLSRFSNNASSPPNLGEVYNKTLCCSTLVVLYFQPFPSQARKHTYSPKFEDLDLGVQFYTRLFPMKTKSAPDAAAAPFSQNQSQNSCIPLSFVNHLFDKCQDMLSIRMVRMYRITALFVNVLEK